MTMQIVVCYHDNPSYRSNGNYLRCPPHVNYNGISGSAWETYTAQEFIALPEIQTEINALIQTQIDAIDSGGGSSRAQAY